MRIGVQTFVTDETMSPSDIAMALEERGFDALFLPEHPHVPVSRTTPYPDAYGGGALPDFYKRPYDPFVAGSFAAAATSDLVIGTGICLLAFRDAVVTAKSTASLDRLSGGRFVFGVGVGWNVDEFASHGQDFSRRYDLVREKVEAIRAIWRNEVAEFHGQHVDIAPSWCWPKPAQDGGPAVWLGGSGHRSRREAARWADRWYPTPPLEDRDLAIGLPAFREDVERAGRDPEEVGVAVAAAAPDPDLLRSYRDSGIEYVSLRLYAKDRDNALRDLDAFAQIREAVVSDLPRPALTRVAAR